MKLHSALITVVTSLIFFASNANALADLIVDVSGVQGSGLTTWTFSGTYDVFTGETVAAQATSTNVVTQWGRSIGGDGNSLGDYANATLDNATRKQFFNPGGTATVTGSGSGVLALDGLLLDHNGGNLDTWGFLSNQSHTYQGGETLTFTGSSTVSVDINQLRGNSNNFSLPYSRSATTNGATLQLNFSAVPEPSTFAMLGLGVVGFGFFRRRQVA